MNSPRAQTQEHIQVGSYLVDLKPTAFLQWENNKLMQWWEASISEAGVTYTKGKWKEIPTKAD